MFPDCICVYFNADQVPGADYIFFRINETYNFLCIPSLFLTDVLLVC